LRVVEGCGGWGEVSGSCAPLFVPRPHREEVEGGVFHVFARGNNRELVYQGEEDYARYRALLDAVVRQYDWRLLAFCLMPNHVHLLVETPKPNLGAGMQRLHGLYARAFNRRHRRCGHVFQGRYGAVRITTDEQLWTVARYIARNPVAAGLCSHPAQWTWGSHAAVVNGRTPHWTDIPRLLGYFEAAGGDGRRRYLAFVDGVRPLEGG
jgi:putative transposase